MDHKEKTELGWKIANWRKIFAHMSMKQIADTIARVFCATALEPGKENADNFIKAFKAMMANK